MKNNQSAARSGSFYQRGGLTPPSIPMGFLFVFLAYMLALCIFQTFHLWCANLIYAAFIVLFLFVPGFSVYKACVYGNALALATSASVVLVVERDILFSIKEYY